MPIIFCLLKAIVAEVETPDGNKVKVDNEVLTQAALLQQMKEINQVLWFVQ